MPVTSSNHNLIKICKQQHRNPIYLAREWRRALDNDEYASSADLARHLKVSRARVTQVLNLLKLSPEVIDMISSSGDPLRNPNISERRLRPLLALKDDQQKMQVEIMLLKCRHT
jgi:hypothetical protein